MNREIVNGKKQGISIIMPAYNEGKRIELCINETLITLQKLQISYEIIVVDDGSDDDTFERATALSRKYSEIKVLRNKKNIGKGDALKRGFWYSVQPLVVFLDSDFEIPPSQIETLYNCLRENKTDVVIASKKHKESIIYYPKHRRLISRVYYFLIRILFNLSVYDTQTGLKLFNRNILEAAMPHVQEKGFTFDLELMIIITRLKYEILEVPTTVTYSEKYNHIRWGSILDAGLRTLFIWFRLNVLQEYDIVADDGL